MAIGQFNKITYDDINNLKNESITTKNIYASGTSATIGTSDNPFNAVYANTYYGNKLSLTHLFSKTPSTLNTGVIYELSDDWRNYLFLSFSANGWSVNNLLVSTQVIPFFYNSSYGVLRLKKEDNPSDYFTFYFPVGGAGVIFDEINLSSDLTALQFVIIGLK